MSFDAAKDRLAASARRPASPELFTNLQLPCPATDQPVAYEAPGDAQTLKDLWARELFVTCPHCGKVHRFSFRDAYIRGMPTAPGSELDQG